MGTGYPTSDGVSLLRVVVSQGTYTRGEPSSKRVESRSDSSGVRDPRVRTCGGSPTGEVDLSFQRC